MAQDPSLKKPSAKGGRSAAVKDQSSTGKTRARKAKSKTGKPEEKAGSALIVAPASEQPAPSSANGAADAGQRKEKIKKLKLVRDSFTMPEAEYQALGDMKKACIKAGFGIKKSELLRIGVGLIRNMTPDQLKVALAGLTPLKAGRSKK